LKPTIEDIEINMDELNKQLERSASDKQRNLIIRKWAGGVCVRCYKIPSKKVSYQIEDALLVERYCDNCFKYMKDGRGKKVTDKFN
jgi:RNase P subunit RPR2